MARDGEDSRASLGGMVDSANASDIMHMETPEAGRNALTAGLQQSHFTKGSGQQQPKPYQGSYTTQDLGNYFDETQGKGVGALGDVPVIGGLANLGKSKSRGDFIQQAQRNHNLGAFNPLHPVDWAKAAETDLQGTWQTGQRMYNGFNALFGDNNAIYLSMHDLYSDHNSFKRQLVNGMTGNALSGLEQLDTWDATRPLVRDLIPGLLTSTVRYGMLAAGAEATAGSLVGGAMARFAPEGTGLASRVLPTGVKWFASNILPVMLMDGRRPDEILAAAVKAGWQLPGAVGEAFSHPSEQNSQILLASVMGAFLIGTGVKNPLHETILSRFPVDKVMGHLGEKGKYAIDPELSTFTKPQDNYGRDPLTIHIPDPPKPTYQHITDIGHGRVVEKLLLPQALRNLAIDAETHGHAQVDVQFGRPETQRISAIPDAELVKSKAEYASLKDAYLAAHKDFVKAKNPSLYRDPATEQLPPDPAIAPAAAAGLPGEQPPVAVAPGEAPITPPVASVDPLPGATSAREAAKAAMEAHPLHDAQVGPKTLTSQEIFDNVNKEIQRLRESKDAMVTSKGEFMGKAWHQLSDTQKAAVKESAPALDKIMTEMGIKESVPVEALFSKIAALGSEKLGGRFMPRQVAMALLDHHEELGKIMGHPLNVDDFKGPDTNLETSVNGTLFDNLKATGEVGNLIHSGASSTIAEMIRGVHANEADPIGQILREGWGDARASDAAVNEHLLPSLLLGLHEQFGRELTGFDPGLMTRMIFNPDEWAKATPIEKVMVQLYRRMTQVARNERRSVGPDRGEEQDYLQRVHVAHDPGTKRGKAIQKFIQGDEPKPMTIGANARTVTEGRRSKVTLIKDGTIQVRDRFGDDPTIYNQKMAEARRSFVNSSYADGNMHFSPEQEAVLMSRGLDPAEIAAQLKGAKPKELVDISHMLFRDRETNFLKLFTDFSTRELKSIKQRQAVDALTKIYMKVPHGDDVLPMQAAVKLDGLSAQERDTYIAAGYRNSLTGHEDYMFHPGYINPLEKVAANTTRGAKDMGALGALIDHGQRLKSAIVYLPMKHRYNVMARQTTFALSEHQPSALFGLDKMEKLKHELTGTGGYDPNKVQDLRNEMSLRNEAWHYGMVPPKAGRYNEGWAASLLNAHGQSTGNVDGAFTDMLDDRHLPKQVQEFIKDSQRGAVSHYAQKLLPNSWHDTGQKWLWDKVDQFGHTVYRVKKQEYISKGMNEISAGLNAADDANKWMGHVRPEAWNPSLHRALNTFMFAPNWQRTEEQLLFPMFDRDWRGVDASPNFKRLLFAQEVRMFSASMLMQQMTGNGLNLLLSGHPQWDNHPGSRTKVEISRPEVLQALQALHGSGTPAASVIDTFLPQKLNKTTGKYETSFPDAGHGQAMYISNPLTAQLEEVERYAGSFAQGGNLSTEDRMREALASGLGVGAPLPAALISTAANMDLFQTLRSGSVQALDPTHNNMLAQLALGLSTLIPVPGAGQGVRQVQAQMETWLSSGTTPHPGTKDMAANIKDDWLRGLVQSATGVSPAYNTTAHTEGRQLSSDDRMKITATEQQYQKDALVAANVAYTNGDFQTWLTNYKAASGQRFSNLQLMYKGTPQPIGDNIHDKLQAYDKLYTDNTRPLAEGGGVDWAKYDDQAQKFWGGLTASESQQLHQVLFTTEAKDPMLRLYRQSIRDYASFQQQIAGVNVGELRKQVNEYNALFGDSKQSRHYLATHPFLRGYEKKKKVWEVTTPAGIAYGLFYGTSAVKTFMDNHQSSKQQILQYTEDQILAEEQSTLTDAGVPASVIAQPTGTG